MEKDKLDGIGVGYRRIGDPATWQGEIEIAANDRVAFGLAGALGETKLRSPALTSVDPQVDQLIDLSVNLLLEQTRQNVRRAVKPRLSCATPRSIG